MLHLFNFYVSEKSLAATRGTLRFIGTRLKNTALIS